MPYIKQEQRNEMDEVVNLMAQKQICADGDLNYILFKYCKYHVARSYNNYKNFIAELRACATEIERRLLAMHEDTKILENGDV